MGNRIIKESICYSETIHKLSMGAEIAFYHLIVNVDDYGRTDARPALLKARMFPLETDMEMIVFQGYMTELYDAGLIWGYEVDGREYIQVNAWNEHQTMRTKRAKYPAPDKSANKSAKKNVNPSQDCNTSAQDCNKFAQECNKSVQTCCTDVTSPCNNVALNPNPNPYPYPNPNPKPKPDTRARVKKQSATDNMQAPAATTADTIDNDNNTKSAALQDPRPAVADPRNNSADAAASAFTGLGESITEDEMQKEQRIQEEADQLVKTYGLAYNNKILSAVAQDIRENGLGKVVKAFEDAVASDHRGGISLKYYRVCLANLDKDPASVPSTRASPPKKMMVHTEDEFIRACKAAIVDLDEEE